MNFRMLENGAAEIGVKNLRSGISGAGHRAKSPDMLIGELFPKGMRKNRFWTPI
jgi:hypothetical protein